MPDINRPLSIAFQDPPAPNLPLGSTIDYVIRVTVLKHGRDKSVGREKVLRTNYVVVQAGALTLNNHQVTGPDQNDTRAALGRKLFHGVRVELIRFVSINVGTQANPRLVALAPEVVSRFHRQWKF